MAESAKPNRDNLKILTLTPESNDALGKSLEHLEWLSDELTVLAVAFGERPTEERQELYCRSLADLPREQLQVAFRRARCELKWFPKIAELRELAGALPVTNDGRPGPEEAWARMPKGEHMEDDSVVWCEEEQAAYNACRSLLLDGDLIGARMAFKERYERELAQARAQRKAARWTVSAGYDMSHRLTALAAAVQEKRITLESAAEFVPSDRRADFAQMLPPAQAQGLLTGRVEKLPDLPGLAGVLARMRMEGTLPEELKADPPRRTPVDRSAEEARQLREKVNAQIEFVKRSRNGHGRKSK